MKSRILAAATLLLIVATSAWAASTEKVLHGFPANGPDGKYPTAGLISDAAGNLYGTTNFGGDADAGAVFELSPAGNGKWTEKVIYSFSGGADGGYPWASLIFDKQGNLYGTAYDGGNLSNCNNGCGVVFELTPNADGTWSETVLHTFLGAAGGDGDAPFGPVTFDAKGNLFGTTSDGGVPGSHCWNGCGYIFELTPQSGGAWSYKNIYEFQGNEDAGNPESQLVFDKQGNLYGTAGTDVLFPEVVFELTPANGTWTFHLLQTFQGCQNCDTFGVLSGVTFDTKRNLYGTLPVSGSTYEAGLLYKLTPAQGLWKLDVLHVFTGGQDGGEPYTAPIFDSAGNMYGTASAGGSSACGCGIVWEATPTSKGGWKGKVLHTFQGQDGSTPNGNLLLDSSGNLYGTTYNWNNGYGTVFEVTP